MTTETNGSTASTRILVVDDHPLMRAGITAVLEGEPDLTVCCAAGSEAEALEIVRTAVPDIAIVDLSLSTDSGFTLFCKLRRLHPELRILVLSMHDETIYAERVLQAGAHGYVMKEAATETLVDAVHTVRNGGLYVSARMRDMLLRGIAGLGPETSGETPRVSSLTPSELVVFQMIGEGLNADEIARRLDRSRKTIDVHRATIRRKLGFRTAEALGQFAARWAISRLEADTRPTA